MRPRVPASFFWATLLLTPVLLVGNSPAQINAPPSSVTSPGFGGRPVNGPPSSVTSLGPRGYSPGFRVGTPGTVPFRQPRGDGHHRHHRQSDFLTYPYYYYAVPVPYATDSVPESEAYQNEDDNTEYQGGPTVFDRRGNGERSYVPPVNNAAPAHQEDRDTPSDSDSVSAPEPAVPTILVFKDGHKLEIGNYAIVNSMLIDLTAGHSRKVALADLNLLATQKENDDRGVVFQLPAPAKNN